CIKYPEMVKLRRRPCQCRWRSYGEPARRTIPNFDAVCPQHNRVAVRPVPMKGWHCAWLMLGLPRPSLRGDAPMAEIGFAHAIVRGTASRRSGERDASRRKDIAMIRDGECAVHVLLDDQDGCAELRDGVNVPKNFGDVQRG